MCKENHPLFKELNREVMTAIQLDNVDFGYDKNTNILDQLCMQVPAGSIYGFLGPNGAGKTTTLKLILRLLKTKSGNIKILTEDQAATYPKYLSKIGSLIENSSLYGHLSAKDNLRIWSKNLSVDKNRIDQVLELIGLQDALKKKVQNFSTGMKQRLGLAVALLHNPDILILDEPTNGLDPMGITKLREILFRLRDNGKTILLSSHILSEVEKVVSHVGILKNGKLAFEGSIAELEEFMQSNIDIILKVNNGSAAAIKLQGKYDIELVENTLSFKIEHQNEVNDIIKTCVNNNIQIFEIYNNKTDLENLFMNISK